MEGEAPEDLPFSGGEGGYLPALAVWVIAPTRIRGGTGGGLVEEGPKEQEEPQHSSPFGTGPRERRCRWSWCPKILESPPTRVGGQAVALFK